MEGVVDHPIELMSLLPFILTKHGILDEVVSVCECWHASILIDQNSFTMFHINIMVLLLVLEV